jgi:hypothetical protein
MSLIARTDTGTARAERRRTARKNAAHPGAQATRDSRCGSSGKGDAPAAARAGASLT